MTVILTTANAAKRVGKNPRTLMRWRDTECGPPYVRLGPKLIGYREDQLEAWIASRTFQHRADEATR